MRKEFLIGSAVFLLSSPHAQAQTRQPVPSAASRQPAPTSPATQSRPRQLVQPHQVPPGPAIAILVKSSLIALNQANATGNYSVLLALGSGTFRARNNSQTLAQTFSGMRSARVNLNPVIVMNLQLTRQPVIEQNRFLRLIGFLATRPSQTNFDLHFEPSENEWKLANLSLSFSQAEGGSAPQAQPQRSPR